jgi:hypothetical protein
MKVEQVIECEISGPELCKSCATQEEIFSKVVVGDAKVCAFLYPNIPCGVFQIKCALEKNQY